MIINTLFTLSFHEFIMNRVDSKRSRKFEH